MIQEPSFKPLSDRVPPQNVDAEEAILGGILLDPEAITRVADILQPQAFYISAHQEIYRTALLLHAQGKPTDLTTITAWLQDNDKLEKIGGQGRIAQLVDRLVSSANIDQYAQLVTDKYLRRQLIKAGNEIIQLGYDKAMPIEEMLDKAEQRIFSLAQERPQSSLSPTAEVLTTTFNEIESRSLGTAVAGIPCNFYDLDAMTQGFQRSDLIIVAGRPAMGKCLTADAEIVMADGSIATIESIYQQRYRSTPQLLTLNQQWKFQFTTPAAYVDDGVKPVFSVTTRLGRRLSTTLTHPFRTIKGWQPLAELSIGSKIAVPRQLPVFGHARLPEEQVKQLADSIIDGELTSPEGFEEIRWTQGHQSHPLGACLEQLELMEKGALQHSPAGQRAATLPRPDEQRFVPTALISRMGKAGKNAHQKTVPNVVFCLPQEQVALFLNRLFATDGWASVLASGQSQIGYATVSEKLARQIQHLLLRFGIIASLKARQVKYRETRRPAWQLDITDAVSLQIFIDEIGIFGKEAAIERVRGAIATKIYHSNRDLIPLEVWDLLAIAKGEESWVSLAKRAGFQGSSNIHVGQRSLTRPRLLALADALNHPGLRSLATSDIYWDEIVAIEPMGLQSVYDLTIPETHNFVANDICVHNTSFVLNLARNIAALHHLPVCVFSLEMSKEQLVYRLLSSEVSIESGRLRAGRVRQEEWEVLGHAISQLSQFPIYIDDTPNISVTEMRSKARRLQAEHGGKLGLILIDYLQLMEGNSDNRVQELSKITRALKGMARELQVPVMTLSQLSRGVEARTNKRPMMSDLRESGSIEQDADLIVMLYRDEYYNPDTPDRGIAEVIIAKHRNGPVGTVKLLFEPQFTRFRNLAGGPTA